MEKRIQNTECILGLHSAMDAEEPFQTITLQYILHHPNKCKSWSRNEIDSVIKCSRIYKLSHKANNRPSFAMLTKGFLTFLQEAPRI